MVSMGTCNATNCSRAGIAGWIATTPNKFGVKSAAQQGVPVTL